MNLLQSSHSRPISCPSFHLAIDNEGLYHHSLASTTVKLSYLRIFVRKALLDCHILILHPLYHNLINSQAIMETSISCD